MSERLDTEIASVQAALKRTEAKLNEMSDYWADNRMPCCPGCAFGSQWTEAVDKADRQGAWLVVLLRRRGLPEDLRRIDRLDWDNDGARKMRLHLDEQTLLKELSKQNKPPMAAKATA